MKTTKQLTFNKNLSFITAVLLSCLLLPSIEQLNSQSLSGRQVMQMVEDVADGNDRRGRTQMTLISKSGQQRIRAMLTYSKDYGKDSKSIFYFEQPADVKGTGFLTWNYDNPSKDDDRWLYLPALKSSRRISGSSKNDYFMGSDLTYDDMGGRSLDQDNHKLTKEELLDKVKCWVVESTPKDTKDMYSKVISYVRQDNHLIAKINFYDKQGKLLKVLKRSDFQKVQGFWISKKMHVQNVQNQHQTVLETKEIKFNLGLDDGMFRVSTLERGHLR